MSIKEIADRLILEESISGNIFPKTEREILFPLTIKPQLGTLQIEGSIYARSIEVEAGHVIVHGPIASQGDIVIKTHDGFFQAQAGLTTLAGLVIGEKTPTRDQLVDGCVECRALIKGDIISNQSIVLNNSIVFGSIKAVNCTLINSIVLGTIHCEDQLNVQMSSLGGYMCREATFLGICMLFNALGESINRPLFLPYEDVTGEVITPSIHLYPALRESCGMRITSEVAKDHPESLLYPDVDWIEIEARSHDPQLRDETPKPFWVLSIGGRIADYSKISNSVESLSEMLRVGFEFNHYSPETKHKQLDEVSERLTKSELSILKSVCL